LHIKRSGGPGLAVAYLGDGTWGQGVVYETLNLAVLWKAPLLFVVEHNGIAQSTPTELAMAGTIAGRVAAFGAQHELIETDCIARIRRQVAAPIARTRDGGGPLVLEFRTRRLGPHSKGDDTRDAATMSQLRADDWYERYADSHPEQFARQDERQRQLVAEVVADVLARPRVA
jgi:pyruvate dehydrogenase E1 component alpha subunit